METWGKEKEEIEVSAPCCVSERECAEKYYAVIGIRNPQKPVVLKRIYAVRCLQGGKKKVKVYIDNDSLLAYHSQSRKGRVYIIVIKKPETLSTDEATILAEKALLSILSCRFQAAT